MNDYLGTPLAIGDYVIMIMPGYRDFQIGKIVSSSPKMFRVQKSNKNYSDINQYPQQLIKIPEDDIPRLIFEKKLQFPEKVK